MGRMGKSMVDGWLNSGLSANKIQIIDPNISTNDKFISKYNLSMKSLEEIDSTQGFITEANNADCIVKVPELNAIAYFA